MTLAVIYWLSFALLRATKAKDVMSTICWVPPTAESNPWARRLFMRFGFKGGLLIVSAVFLVIASGQYVLVWIFCAPWVQALNAGLGFFIAWVQWDVARSNATGTHSRITLFALRCYRRWERWWRRPE
jgi:hypothetical protein